MPDIISDKLIHALGLEDGYKVTKLAGNANDNYLIRTTSRNIVVKCLGEHTPENEELEGIYRQHLMSQGLPVAPFLAFKNGKYVYSNNGHDYVALDYIEGVEARDKEPVIADQVAVFMARTHQLDYDLMPKRVNWLDGTYLERVCNEVHLDNELVEELKQQNESFIDFWKIGLPQGIIHGDLHGGNIIINANDQIVSVVDWEEVGIVPLVLDVAGAVQDLAQSETGFNQEVFEKFIKTYQSIRPMTKAEKDVFSESIRYRSFIVYLWALMKYKQGLMGAKRLNFFKQRYYNHPAVPTIQQ